MLHSRVSESVWSFRENKVWQKIGPSKKLQMKGANGAAGRQCIVLYRALVVGKIKARISQASLSVRFTVSVLFPKAQNRKETKSGLGKT